MWPLSLRKCFYCDCEIYSEIVYFGCSHVFHKNCLEKSKNKKHCCEEENKQKFVTINGKKYRFLKRGETL